MATKQSKVKQLAKELGVTSRRVIDLCREEGIPIQNSIAKLRPDVERLVRARIAASE